MNEEESQFELSETEFLARLIEHEPVLRAFTRVIVPDWDLVGESLQEAGVTMWQKRGQLDSSDGFLPWTKVILRFKCLKQLGRLDLDWKPFLEHTHQMHNPELGLWALGDAHARIRNIFKKRYVKVGKLNE